MVKEKEELVETAVGSTTAKSSPMKQSSDQAPSSSTKQSPPIIITVDAAKKREESNEDQSPVERRDAESTSSFVQANTPKHANKTVGASSTAGGTRDDPSPPPGDGVEGNQKITPERKEDGSFPVQEKNPFPRRPMMSELPRDQQAQLHAQFAPLPHYDGAAPPPAGGAFAPRQPYGGQGAHYPVSPGTAGGSFAPPYPRQYQGPPPEYYNHGRFHGGPPPAQYRSLPNSGRQPPYARGPPHFPHHGVYNESQQYTPYDMRFVDQQATSTGAFSRAVSSSFDRSSHPEGRLPPHVDPKYFAEPVRKNSLDGMGSLGDDDSWKQLKQVTSVDEDAIAARMVKADGQTSPTDKRIASASSSLTSSPVEGKEPGAKPLAGTKITSLDSLSSVASLQEKIRTEQEGKQGNAERLSPGSASAAESLDLMKCHSGSSGLLNSFPDGHRRGESLTSVHMSTDDDGASKRVLEDADQPQAKRSRMERTVKGDAKKGSPLSITCSPPTSPSADKQERQDGAQKLMPRHQRSSSHSLTASPGVAFHPPSYSYSLESASSRGGGYPPLPPRPSSSTSTTTPGAEGHPRDGLGQSLPSWELQGQDSFGGGSHGPLMPNFSFTQEYPMLANSGSNLGFNEGKMGGLPPHVGAHHTGQGMYPAMAESRNQSFDGGHYHGSFGHSDSMDMAYPPAPHHGGPPGPYKGQFPPHAPSWGSTNSMPAGFQRLPPRSVRFRDDPRMQPVMRNYSEDAPRTSPPGPAHGFPPPRDFNAPSNQTLTRRAPPVPVYLMSSSRPPMQQHVSVDPSLIAKQNPGIYGWSKEDDSKLSLVMKKYKNPRNWEPIAKEHGRGKTAKECHERWIRYLKPGVRKGQWTDQEDAIVVEAVTTSTEQPFTRWSDLANRLPGRVGKQIRDRWVNHLNPHINHLPFSREDDLLLWEGNKVCGKRWVEISTRFFNSSRSENHIKNRWYSASFKKFISNEFGAESYNVATKGKGPKGKSKGFAKE